MINEVPQDIGDGVEHDTIPLTRAEIGVGLFLDVCNSMLTDSAVDLETFIFSTEFQNVYNTMRLMVGKIMADEVRDKWFSAHRERFILPQSKIRVDKVYKV